MHNIIKFKITIPIFKNNRIRLDKGLSLLLPEYSRSYLKKWILNNQIYIDNRLCNKPSTILKGKILIVHESIKLDRLEIPEKIPLDIIYEDKYLMIINKPSGLVVHPGAGNLTGTMLNAILFKLYDNIIIPRAGIVHRLDKDTTGLIIVAKTLNSYHELILQLKKRIVIREYKVLVEGQLNCNGTIRYPISRHTLKRTTMTINPHGKIAITHFKVLKLFKNFTYLKVRLETGRTHQIRVHMAYINHAIVGDPVYFNQRQKTLIKDIKDNIKVLNDFHRQALHAAKIRLVHPKTKKIMQWKINLPNDMQRLLNYLKKNNL
ncbi:RluA family pseudouridine synthase [Buchnera aphidicola (Hormaphis cornu)]|nr:RluA family pseudouridine synthase [Buchnera aphidicola (Hormaphis cornu)]